MQLAERLASPVPHEPRQLLSVRDVRGGDLLPRLDALVLRLKRRHPGRYVTRESVIRELLYRALRPR